MTTHLFLTGDKGIGKSTLIKKLLAYLDLPAGGFFTVKTADVFPGRVSLHLLRAGRDDKPSPENFLAFCKHPDNKSSERFNTLGPDALSPLPGVRILVMDELGPHEENALLFRNAVLSALDGELPVLGVLQKADSPFLRQIAEHPRVKLLEVTAENREHLFESMLQDIAHIKNC